MNTATAIETSTGRYVDLLAPDPETIVLADIAAHLSRICRFGGACYRFYSVAEHVLLVADRLRSQGHGTATILNGIHHDSHEAYASDRTRPYKLAVRALAGPGLAAEEEIDERLSHAIAQALSLPAWATEGWAAIKAADNWALAAEAWHLLPSRGVGWVTEGMFDADDPGNPPMTAGLLPGCRMFPAAAEGMFIAQHNRWAGMLADMAAARP